MNTALILYPKRKAPDYYQKTQKGLGYVSMPIPLDFESEESLFHFHSSGMSSEESNVSVVLSSKIFQ